FQRLEERLGGGQGRSVARGLVVGGQCVQGEGIQVNMLAGVRRLAGIGDLGEVAAVLPVAELALEEVESGLGRGEDRLLLDAGRRQGTEEPHLAGLEGYELLSRRGELVRLKGLEIAAVLLVDAGRKIKIDDAGLEDLPAAAGLGLQIGR